MNIFETPIFFVNRNRYDALVKCITWLKTRGFNNLTVLDNGSTYPPLLEYYSNESKSINIIKLNENHGPWVFWKLGLHKKITTNYIVTDSDIVPCDFCPSNLIQMMHETLGSFSSIDKVGPSLDLISINKNYLINETAYKWEMHHWHKPVGHNLFAAGIDTTFAMYKPEKEFTNNDRNNLRLGYPFLVEHTPWNVDESNLNDEEIYYRNNTQKGFSFWSTGLADPRILEHSRIKNETKKILHIGCGNQYIPGWINADQAGRKIDLEFDFNNCGSKKIPLEENSIDGFYTSFYIERIQNLTDFLHEIHRVGKNDSKLFIRSTHSSNDNALANPENIRQINELSFNSFCRNICINTTDATSKNWILEEIKLVVDQATIAMGGKLAYSHVKSKRNVAKEMVLVLRLVKDDHSNESSSSKPPSHILTSNPLIHPIY